MRAGALVVVAIVLGPGCGSSLVLHAEVPRPAAIPARSFPVVCIAASPGEESREIAEAIATHLAGGESEVTRSTPDALLADAAARGTALAVLVRAEVVETIRTQMTSVPRLSCSSGPGCDGYPVRLPVDVRIEVGTVLVRAFDPESGAELGRASLTEEESEPSPIAARLAVIERLRARAPQLFDVRREVIDLELDPLSDPPGRAALDDARAGRVHAGRLALEARVAASADAERRSAMAFDLGQLVRVDVDAAAADPTLEESSRLDTAERWLLEAVRLDPSERHARALAQLRAERIAREDVRAQEAAADANFASGP